MRALFLFVGLILLALLISASINYPLYLLLEEHLSSGPHKLINTTGKLLAIPGFIFLLHYLQINNKKALGYAIPRKEFLVDLGKGLAMGLSILLILAIVLVFLDIRILKPSEDILDVMAKTLIVAVIGGLLIGFIEETFFRGGLFSAIRKNNSFATTALLSSLFYAWMHFISPPSLPEGEVASWSNSFWILANTFNEYFDIQTLDGFIALFLLGIYLAIVRERTGNIAYVIGVHAGVVMVIKSLKKFTEVNDASQLNFLISNYDQTIGYLSATGLAIHIVFVYFFWRRPEQKN